MSCENKINRNEKNSRVGISKRLANLTRIQRKISGLRLRDLTYLIKWIELRLTYIVLY